MAVSNADRRKQMSILVSLHLAEHFLNWYTSHTKLYIRGQRGKDWETQRALDKELFDQLCAFFKLHGVVKDAKPRIDRALELLDKVIEQAPAYPTVPRTELEAIRGALIGRCK